MSGFSQNSLTLGPSYWARYWQLAGVALILLALGLLLSQPELQLGLLLLLLGGGWYGWRRPVAAKVSALRWRQQDWWLWQDGRWQWMAPRQAWLSPWLIILYTPQPLLIWRDSCQPDDFRRLRVRLLWQGLASPKRG